MRPLALFLTRPANRVAVLLLCAFALVAALAPYLAPPDDPANPLPFKVVGDPVDKLPRPPNAASPLGTEPGQLDVYYTVIWGTRSALLFGVGVTLLTACIGALIGAISGYAGGTLGDLLMRFTDAMMSFPLIAAAWMFDQWVFSASVAGQVYETGPTTFELLAYELKVSPILIAFVLFSWMPYARLVNAQVRIIRDSEFVLAARSVGAGRVRILLRHLLPNSIAPAIVIAARDIGGLVVLAATFTFIGIGRASDWGALLVVGRQWIVGPAGSPVTYWWVYIPVTLVLILFSAAWNLLGDGLNAAFDPRQREF